MQPGQRDTFLDVVRAGAILAVITQHWLMPVLSYSSGHLVTGNALATPGWAVITWASQVMPLVFFAGGAANFISLHRAASARDWLAGRIGRLLLPVLPLAAVWLAAPGLLSGLGAPEQPVEVAGVIAGQLLWFLAVYLLTVLATPLMAVAHRRWGLLVPAVLAVLAVLVDVVRFDGFGPFGYLNAVFVWLAVHQLGFHYVDGKLGALNRKSALTLSATGFGITALMVAFGPYPMSMIGMPGAPVSNMSPPTALLLSLAVGQLGLVLALRPQLRTLAERPLAGDALRWIGARFMSIYLWHMPALVIVAGISVLGFGYATPEPGSLRWFATAPLWFAAATTVLIGLLRVFGRFERPPALGAPAPMARLVTAALLGAAGLLGLAARGFTSPIFTGPVPSVLLVLMGVLLASRPSAVPVKDFRG
ncbi:acyltransferase family protein [Amycolatopsis pithecellobii]|uniref:Acyltransferase family protein n=1 Tax=Amycolatopsis pithecellobii TaxID=664692 RepID=A0A6N7Z7H6_9PSEU|nr:acyltransferase [Amycolatopsis pithecellobii]MTD57201.1 acyltransferase family protein [Amycolatopsis pithecellobii]